MRTAKTTSDRSQSSKQMYIKFYQKEILNYYNLPFTKFVKLSQERRLELSLKVLPTTAKVVSKAFIIPIESLCRRKRELEIARKLQHSRKRAVCPYTGAYAFLLTTDEFLFNSKYFGI
jgi:hypothetical protein